MAKGRMINNKITSDKRINDLSSDTSRLAFTWLVTFADVEGRTHGDPAMVRSMLFPRREDITGEMMADYIREWASSGLVIWYEAAGDWWIQFSGFDKNQSLRKDKEPASQIPAPDGYFPVNDAQDGGQIPEEVRTNSGLIPEKDGVNLKELNLIDNKFNLTETEKTTAAVFSSYSENIEQITPIIADKLGMAIDDYPGDWILQAIDEAVKNNVRKFAYIDAILKNWRNGGKGAGKKKKQNEHQPSDYIGGKYADFIEH